VLLSNGLSDWGPAPYPKWDDNNEYRVKVEPKPDHDTYMNVYRHGKGNGCRTSAMSTLNACQKKSSDYLRGIVRFVIDGETGKLNSAEVIG